MSVGVTSTRTASVQGSSRPKMDNSYWKNMYICRFVFTFDSIVMSYYSEIHFLFAVCVPAALSYDILVVNRSRKTYTELDVAALVLFC